MSKSTKKIKTDGLGATEETLSPTAEQQTDIVDYVQNVKKALASLVDQVAEDQKQSSRIVEKTRDELQSQKTVTAKLSESLDTQVKTLQSKCDEQEAQLAHVQSELDQTTQNFQDELRKQKEAPSNEEEMIGLKNQLQDMQVSSKAAKRRIENLENTLKEQSDDIESSQNLQQELVQQTLELAEQAELLSIAQHAADDFKAKLDPLQQELDEARNNLALLEKNKAEAFQAQNAEQQELTDACTHIETLEGQLQKQTQEIDRLTQSFSEAQASLTPLQTKLDNVVASEATSKQELREVHKHITKLNYSLEEEKKLRIKAEQSQNAAMAATNVQETQEQLRTYRERIAALETTENASADTILKLKEELKKTHKSNTQGRTRLEELRDRAKATLNTDQQKDDRIRFLEEKLATNQDTKNAQQNVHRNLHEQIVTLEKQLKSAVHCNETLKAQLASEKGAISPKPPVNVELKILENNNRLGRLLLKSGVITQAQLDEVLAERQHPDFDRTMRIGHQFIKKGYASEDMVAQALAHQMKIPFLRIEHNTVNYNAVHRVTKQLAEMHQCMPVFIQAGNLMLAMVNPIDLVAIEDIERSSGYPVKVMISTSEDIHDAINQYYKKSA